MAIAQNYNGTDITNGLFNIFGGVIDGVQQQGVNVGLLVAITLVIGLATGAFKSLFSFIGNLSSKLHTA